jgi:HAD superfamily hydrolase (TIGR01549 family)
MDMTLYRHEDYYRSQIKNQVVLLAQQLGKDPEALELELKIWQKNWSSRHEGRHPSFGNTLLGALGIPIEQSVQLRRQAIRPHDYLSPDVELRATLVELAQTFQMVLVTNNPSDIAELTLDALGVADLFPRIIGLDQAGESKPAPVAFRLALEALGCPADQVVSIGDRYEVDLEVPLNWGCGGILVESMKDVYDLPGVLVDGKKS